MLITRCFQLYFISAVIALRRMVLSRIENTSVRDDLVVDFGYRNDVSFGLSVLEVALYFHVP